MAKLSRRLIFIYSYNFKTIIDSFDKTESYSLEHQFQVLSQPESTICKQGDPETVLFFASNGWVLYTHRGAPKIDLAARHINLQGYHPYRRHQVFEERLTFHSEEDDFPFFIERAKEARAALKEFDLYLIDESNPVPNRAPEDITPDRYNSLELDTEDDEDAELDGLRIGDG